MKKSGRRDQVNNRLYIKEMIRTSKEAEFKKEKEKKEENKNTLKDSKKCASIIFLATPKTFY